MRDILRTLASPLCAALVPGSEWFEARERAARFRSMLAFILLATIVQTPQSSSVARPESVPYAETIGIDLHSVESAGDDVGHRASEGLAQEHSDTVVSLDPVGVNWFDQARFDTRTVTPLHPFRELLVSWNVRCPENAGFSVEVRVAPNADAPWSPWMYVGDWGQVPAGVRNVACEGGKIDTDYFRGEHTFARAQLRVSAFRSASEKRVYVTIAGLWCCASDPEARVPWISHMAEVADISAPALTFVWKRRLDVPFRSQRSEAAEIAGRICSPTSLSMVLAYRGVDEPTSAVCARALDGAHGIYGNWPRNIQAAYSLGVPGYLTRFTNWTDVQRSIAKEQPIIASIAAKEGELHGAPYKKTDGHLLVITGFDAQGDVCVNDPAAVDAKSGQTTYARADMQKVWLDRGGTAYVLLAKP
jgi:hypothetical protein